jgi:hypothetical protein
MKKTIAVMLFALLVHGNAWAFETKLLEARNKIFEEAKQLQSLMGASQDPVALVSLWDSCIVTATQLNAYFYMVGIFESMEAPGAASVSYLKSWLEEVKRTTLLNVRNLSASADVTEAPTKEHLSRVKAYFSELALLLEREIGKVSQLEKKTKAAASRQVAPVQEKSE